MRWVLGEQRPSSLEGPTCRMSFFRDGKQKTLWVTPGGHYLDNSDHQLPIDYEEVTVAGECIALGKVSI